MDFECHEDFNVVAKKTAAKEDVIITIMVKEHVI